MNEREPIPLLEWKNRHSPANADLLVIAERELGAFISAVTELFRAGVSCEASGQSIESMKGSGNVRKMKR